MPLLPQSGTCIVERSGDDHLSRLRVTWTADGDGLCVCDLPEPPNGTLVRLLAMHTDASTGNYSVTLLDSLGADVLLGLCATLTLGTASDVPIYGTLGSSYRAVIVAGDAQLQVDTSGASEPETYGCIDLHYSPAMDDFLA